MSLREDAAELQPELAALRRELHQIPEIGLDLPRTQERVLTALAPAAAGGHARHRAVVGHRGAARRRPARSCCCAATWTRCRSPRARARRSRPSTTARCTPADTTCTPPDWSARRSCSRARRADLAGDVVFMFQPGEEGWDGAGHMIAEGVLDAAGRPADAAYGLHVQSSVLAARRVRVPARPAHGRVRRPVRTGDRRRRPRVAAARRARPGPGGLRDGDRAADDGDPPVRRVRAGGGHGRLFHAGTRRNIIPDEATFEATVRTFNPEVREQVAKYAVAAVRGHRGRARAAGRGAATSERVPGDGQQRGRGTTSSPRPSARSSARSGSPSCRIRSPARRTSPGCWSGSRASYMFLGACATDDPEHRADEPLAARRLRRQRARRRRGDAGGVGRAAARPFGGVAAGRVRRARPVVRRSPAPVPDPGRIHCGR